MCCTVIASCSGPGEVAGFMRRTPCIQMSWWELLGVEAGTRVAGAVSCMQVFHFQLWWGPVQIVAGRWSEVI